MEDIMHDIVPVKQIGDGGIAVNHRVLGEVNGVVVHSVGGLRLVHGFGDGGGELGVDVVAPGGVGLTIAEIVPAQGRGIAVGAGGGMRVNHNSSVTIFRVIDFDVIDIVISRTNPVNQKQDTNRGRVSRHDHIKPVLKPSLDLKMPAQKESGFGLNITEIGVDGGVGKLVTGRQIKVSSQRRDGLLR
eukprot:Lithocolla_globosa_v1_NODE_2831_length_1854_cov_41.631462.p3 type:complete len:187 gc:universal NODE_2831_length_1854_cov_41.631462:885-1445(+)